MSSTPERSRRYTGFTLAELLIVVGLIGLLVSLLLPSVTATRTAATRVKCAATLQQIGSMFSVYANEYGGYVPRGYSGLRAEHPGFVPWVVVAFPKRESFVNDEELEALTRRVTTLRCPSETADDLPVSYVVNAFANEEIDPVAAGRYLEAGVTRLTQIRRASEVVLAGDGEPIFYPGEVPAFIWNRDFWEPETLPYGLRPRLAHDRHGPNGLNLLMFDFSVRFVPASSVTPRMMDDGIRSSPNRQLALDLR
jgi:type II secretory pathway pseudopilin PulG